MTMPKLTGIELLHELRQIRPDIPIILCTGFSESATPERIQSLEISAFLTKPVTSRELAQILYKVVGAQKEAD
jgi:CheY-like chemotaxis protein